MKLILLISLLLLTALSLPNQRPIIGIITQVNFYDASKEEGENINTIISNTVVEYMAMSGAQVVPIFSYSDESEIAELLPKLNGVLFPGGAGFFDIKDRWTSNANFIFEYAKKQNDQGNVFPIIGICLGHQLLSFLTNNFENPLERVTGQSLKINTVNFISNDKGYLFSEVPSNLIEKLTNSPGIAFFDHRFAISRKTYDENARLNSFWKLIAETTTIHNERFVSVWEAKDYPFYGFQYHPETESYGWRVNSTKSYDSVRVSQIISNRFMEKARQSKNFFSSQTEFEEKNIYNYNPLFTPIDHARVYFFNETKPRQSKDKAEKPPRILIGCSENHYLYYESSLLLLKLILIIKSNEYRFEIHFFFSCILNLLEYYYKNFHSERFNIFKIYKINTIMCEDYFTNEKTVISFIFYTFLQFFN